jgi:hypothetical protein
MAERRIHTRLLCSELVTIERRSAAGWFLPAIANLEDISLSGACLCSETAIRPGDPVVLCYADGELPGFVRYCVYRDLGYLIGIEFGYKCEWPIDFYRPEHLLNPETLRSRVPGPHDPQLKSPRG